VARASHVRGRGQVTRQPRRSDARPTSRFIHLVYSLTEPPTLVPVRLKDEALHLLVVFVALFSLYAYSAPRTVTLEDDGLFIMSSYFLGVDHPPGYPLMTVLGKLFTLLPVGSIAFRVHLLSAFFGGLTCVALWLVIRSLLDVLVTGHHRRELHPQHVFLLFSVLRRARIPCDEARQVAPCLCRDFRARSRQPLAVDASLHSGSGLAPFTRPT